MAGKEYSLPFRRAWDRLLSKRNKRGCRKENPIPALLMEKNAVGWSFLGVYSFFEENKFICYRCLLGPIAPTLAHSGNRQIPAAFFHRT